MNLDASARNSMESRVKKFCEDADADLQKLSSLNLNKKTAVDSQKEALELYKEEYLCYRQKYEAIRDASFWKMTAPLRKAMDLYRYIRTGEKREQEWESRIPMASVSSNGKARIGVHLHLYYEDLLLEFCEYLNHIPEPFDLYISCKKSADQSEIARIAQKIAQVKRIVVKETVNRGRDIAPFYVLFRKELQQYPLLLHIHSKKSLYTGDEKSEWRHWALNGVLKNENVVRKIIDLLGGEQSDTGLVFGEMNPTLPLFALHWLHNISKGAEILARIGIPMENTMLFYPVGSFFWAKTEAIQPLFDLQLTYKDFENEQGQIDGTLAHALERIVARVVQGRGYNMYIFDQRSGQFSLNKSYESFKKYAGLNCKYVVEMLSSYDLVTFDIFDTLITRLVYQPDDLFNLLERILKEKYGVAINFLKKRKEAEALAWKEYGDFCSIHHIYEKLPLVTDFTEGEAAEIKQLEIDLEMKLCVPRRDVLSIYRDLLKAGKRIILVSDMYLPGDIIEKILAKCGFSGYEELWISCDKGKRKDKDTIWDDFLETYGALRTIHVGDNAYSDCQLLSDRGRDYLLLLSSAEQFRLSRQYDRYRPFIDGTVEHSLVLGYMVNQCLYNSPFAMGENGVPCLDSPDKLSRGIYGPLFLAFCEYIHKTSRDNTKLLFLAREGYFFQKLYKKYCQEFGYEERENYYFLTSRRATSVAQIETYLDAKELLKTNFDGKMAALFLERYGLTISEEEGNEPVKLPRDMGKAILVLKKHAAELLDKAQDEKAHYLRYIKQEIGKEIDWDQVTVVDLGYAGTIQSYLMKIVEHPMDGCYMVTDYHMKPENGYGTSRGLYSFWESKRFDDNKLFLESVAAAPHGQVIRFEEQDGKERAVLKKENAIYGKNALVLQEPVYCYLEEMAALLDGIESRCDKNLAECIFSEMIQEGALSKDMQGMFLVEDGYCAGGEWIFDEGKNKWVLRKDI